MVEKVCDPRKGWMGIGHVWAHCRGLEDACVEVELIDVSDTQARIKITTTFKPDEEYFIDSGEVYGFWESTSDSPYWTITCAGVNKTAAQASIEICYEEGGTPDGTEVGEEFEAGGETFKVKEILCALGGAIVTHVNTGTSLEVFVNKLTVFLIPGGIQIYMIGVAVDATCRYFAQQAMKFPEEIPTEPTPGNEEGTKGPFDETTFLEKKRANLIETMGQEFSDTIDDAVIIAKDKELWKGKGNLDCFQKVMRQFAAGEITEEEANKLTNECIIAETVKQVTKTTLIQNFSITVPSYTMAGDVEISGTAPKANETFQIMAVQKWLGYDAFAADKMLAEVTSGDDYKFKTTVALKEFGALTIYAKAPKEWFEIWVVDVETERHTVYVITWMIVLAVLVAAALMYDKKKKGKFIGVFKKRK